MGHKISKLIVVILFFIVHPAAKTQTIRDIDGNFYKTITIGTQTWLAENLKTTRFNDGVSIPLASSDKSWGYKITPTFCWYNNDETKYKNKYGALYNWYTVKTGKLCPIGWHVPSDNEWTILTEYLGVKSAGGKLKEVGSTHWFLPNEDSNNETGFTALPGGSRNMDCSFDFLGRFGYWWSSTDTNSNFRNYATYRCLSYYVGTITGGEDYKGNGFSVRCLKDF
ncbi:MAG: fibrobacter succinogenes major paralogous domain-containing protein [Bacteroidales bacterium]|jgi:uncharacterized protein (TIGR02145 family)